MQRIRIRLKRKKYRTRDAKNSTDFGEKGELMIHCVVKGTGTADCLILLGVVVFLSFGPRK